MPEDLQVALDALGSRRPDIARDIRWYSTLPSTMDVVARAADEGAPAGFVVVADTQTAGRGRRGRRWSSPPGAGVYLSYLARPSRHVGLLTLAAGVAVRAGLRRATGLVADVKWPNDLLVGSRKLAGLLAEASRAGTSELAATIGVGINLRASAHPPEVAERATSLEAELGHPVDRGVVVAAVIESLADRLTTLEAGGAHEILDSWRAASPSAIGVRVSWVNQGQWHAGVTAGVDDSGALMVRTTSGVERVIAGELQWELP